MSELTLTDATFTQEVLNEPIKPVLVDFWAAWCGPCKIQGPIVSEIAKQYEGKAKIAKFDVDANPQTAQQFSILSIPTTMIFKAGKAVWQGVGVQQKKDLEEQLDKVLGA